jgi:hypothetical protein
MTKQILQRHFSAVALIQRHLSDVRPAITAMHKQLQGAQRR